MPTPLIINPAAGRGTGRALSDAICCYLRELGISARLSYSGAAGDISVQVRQAVSARAHAVIVVGGDGTVHEAVNGWMQAGGGAPLAIIPAGTGNDFMKMLSDEPAWREACRRIARGSTRRVDLGRCNDFYFANSLGVGFDAQVASEANRMQWLHGNLVYGVALAKTLLFSHCTPSVCIQHAAGRLDTPITLIAVNNGRVEGGAFRLAPNAEINDGVFDVVIARGMSRLGILTLVPRVLRGTHLDHRSVTIFKTGKLTIESEKGLPVHADGEIRYRDAKRLDIEILPAGLTVIA